MRDLMPGASPTVGGLPSRNEPQDAPIGYAFDITVRWESGIGPDPVPVLGIHDGLAGLTPSPASTRTTIAMSLPTNPVATPPTQADIPPDEAWETVATDAADTLAIPVLSGSLFAAGTPFWLRLEVTDDHDATSRAVGWFPTGLPVSSADDLHVWVAVNASVFTELTAIGGDIDPMTPDSVHFADIKGTLPDPAQAVAVTVAFGSVVVEGKAGGVPVPVDATVNVDLGVTAESVGGAPSLPVVVKNTDPVPVLLAHDPLPVSLPAPVETVLTARSATQVGAGSGTPTVVPAGAVSVSVVAQLLDAGTSVSVNGAPIFLGGSTALGTIWRLDTPPGTTLPAVSVECDSGGGNATVSILALSLP